MAGEEQYINPIIQSMISTAQLSQRGKANEEEKRKNIEAEKARQEQLKQEQQRITNENEYRKAMVEHESKRLQLEHDQASLHSRQIIADLVGKGFDVGKLGFPQAGSNPTQLNAGNATLPDFQQPANEPTYQIPGIDQPVPASGFPSSSELLAKEMERARGIAGAQTQGQMEAAKPFKIEDLNRETAAKKDILAQTFGNEKQLTSMKEDWEGAQKKLDRSTQLQIANIHTGPEMEKLRLEYGGGNPAMMGAITKQLLTGQAPYSDTNPLLRTLGAKATAAGAQIPQKGDWQALRASEELLPLFDKLKQFANDNLPSEATQGKTMARGQAMVQGLSSKLPIPTEAKTKYDEIMSQIFRVGQQLDSATGGRYPVMLINKIAGGLTDLGTTKELALDKLNNMQNIYGTKLQNDVMAGWPDWQKKLAYSSGITPDYVRSAPPKNSLGLPLNKDKSIQAGQPVYGQ